MVTGRKVIVFFGSQSGWPQQYQVQSTQVHRSDIMEQVTADGAKKCGISVFVYPPHIHICIRCLCFQIRLIKANNRDLRIVRKLLGDRKVLVQRNNLLQV